MKKTLGVGHQTDEAMRITWLTLCDDLGISGFQPIRAAIARGDIREARMLMGEYRLSYQLPAGEFKRIIQLLSWFKRYRFANDLFTDEDLRRVSWKSYSDTQLRICKPIRIDTLYRSGLVSRWRAIARSILGEYTESEHFERCSFAKNACLGHPAKRKGLDQKLKGPFTGSMEHISFLQRYCETDPTLREILETSKLPLHPAPSLRLTFVPKSFKALRAIMPDTLTGSFYSSGLGEMIQSRLTHRGLNINTLQRKHRRIAMLASRVSGWKGDRWSSAHRLATVDLSSASDSITPQLLSIILPRKWFKAVMNGRIPYYLYDGKRYRLSSACTMGLGYTFPLETLVFYVLTRGVAEWYGQNAARSVSVYGDDIIVPTEVLVGNGFPSLTSVFRSLHLQINPDKSFWGWCSFRESCGGDYYRGHDVRPASPEAVSSTLHDFSYAAFLYKIANSLLRRWPQECIENTLGWISSEVFRTLGEVHVIPDSFPDTSGLKVTPNTFFTDEPERCNFGSFVVKCIREIEGSRRCTFEKPLFWDSLRVRSTRMPYSFSIRNYEAPHGPKVRTRKVRFKGGYRTVSFLALPSGTLTGYKTTKSICPYWK